MQSPSLISSYLLVSMAHELHVVGPSMGVCVPCQAHLSGPLLEAARRLLAVLLSCTGGLDLLLRNTVAVAALLKALDPANDPCGPPLPAGDTPARCGALPSTWSFPTDQTSSCSMYRLTA